MAVVANVFEENTATKERDLESLDVDVGTVGAPCVGADGVRHESGKEAIEVEEEKDGSTIRQPGHALRERQSTHRIPHISSSTR